MIFVSRLTLSSNYYYNILAIINLIFVASVFAVYTSILQPIPLAMGDKYPYIGHTALVPPGGRIEGCHVTLWCGGPHWRTNGAVFYGENVQRPCLQLKSADIRFAIFLQLQYVGPSMACFEISLSWLEPRHGLAYFSHVLFSHPTTYIICILVWNYGN